MASRRWPAALAALAVLFVGVTNAHAHVRLCFDGKPPPAAVHAPHDGGHAHVAHHAHHGDEHDGHHDFDLDLRDPGLTKSFKLDLPVVAVEAVCLLPVAAHIAETPITAPGDAPSTDPPHSRPQLRAPPATLL